MSETTYEQNVNRRRMIEGIESFYPIDSENDGALRYVNSETEGAEAAPRYVLIQTHANGRRWHEFSDDRGALLKYAEDDDEWQPFLIVDLDTGVAQEVKMTASLGDVQQTFERTPDLGEVGEGPPLESIEAIVAYNMEQEERDHAEQVQAGEIEPGDERHIYTHLRRVSAWVDSQ